MTGDPTLDLIRAVGMAAAFFICVGAVLVSR